MPHPSTEKHIKKRLISYIGISISLSYIKSFKFYKKISPEEKVAAILSILV
jgi:hypothetical protein